MAKMNSSKNKPLKIIGVTINPGERKVLAMNAASLYAQTSMNIPVHVIHGEKPGNRLFIIAAVHGDEINGVEIIRRVLNHPALKKINGTLIAVPIANVHGFITLSRNLPDRRDLNRSFPGSKTGSLTARVANLFMKEIISKCSHGIDLHSGNIHSENVPHIRINTDIPGAVKMAYSFNLPIILDAKLRDGSIRQAATELKIPVIVFEGGEALRFNEVAIRVGIQGILNVLHTLKMIKNAKPAKPKRIKSKISFNSVWSRAPMSGIFNPQRKLGKDIETGEKLGYIIDPFTSKEVEILSPLQGVIIGINTLPLVNEGDALFHIAKLKNSEDTSSQIDALENYFLGYPFSLY